MAKKILFVCTGNTCRSSMAHGLARELVRQSGGDLEVEIRSAGTHAYDGAPASEGAIAALRARGIDLGEHRATFLTRDLIEEADLILTMTPAHKAYILDWIPEAAPKVFLLKEYALGEEALGQEGNLAIGDPYGQPVEVYQEVAEELADLVAKVLARIRQEAGKQENM